MNSVLLVGRLFVKPQLKSLPSGMVVAAYTISCPDQYKDRQGKQVERPCFVDVEAFGRLGELCAKYLSDGSPVLVLGSLKLDEWTDEAGTKKNRLRVRASDVQFLQDNGESKPSSDYDDSVAPLDSRNPKKIDESWWSED